MGGKKDNVKISLSFKEEKIMKITAWILVFALCLTIGFADTGRENAAPIALAAEESAENEVWEYKAIGAGKVAITKYTGEDTRLQIPETIETDSGSCIVAENWKRCI